MRTLHAIIQFLEGPSEGVKIIIHTLRVRWLILCVNMAVVLSCLVKPSLDVVVKVFIDVINY